MSAAIADLVPPADRARAYGLIYWVINLGFAIGLALGGLLAGISFTWLFIGDGLTMLLFALLIRHGVPETLHTHAAPTADRPRVSGWQGFAAPYRDAPFVGLVVLNFLLWVVFMQNSTTFPIDTAAHGVSRSTFGLILGLNGIVIVLVQPLLGPVLIRRDRSRSLALGSALVGIGFGLNALFHTAPLYALGVVVWTVGEICVLPVLSAVVADVAPRHMRGRYQGASGFAFGLATCLAPLLGTLVFERFGSATLWLGTLALGGAVAAGHLLLGPRLRRLREARLAN
jgi:MFS family permease